MRCAAWNRNNEITASNNNLPIQCWAKPSTRAYSSVCGGIHTPIGAMMPVMKISIGAISAESTPPAPNSDQNIGSWDRFMSHPPHDDEDDEGGAEGGEHAAAGDQHLGYGVTRDADVGRSLGCNLPPGVGVVTDGQQREPVKED